nr:hypothetical protein [Tanacetum cinerariifolium]
MADLEFVNQHNMVACLERIDGNAEFHQIVDFLTTSPIHYALTISLTIYVSYIEQFWATSKSKTVNDVKQVHVTVDGKTVVISESSVRSDLHFNDVDGITCLSNDDIFINLALMGKLVQVVDPVPIYHIGDADAQTRFKTASRQFHDPPLLEVNISGSKEDNMEHQDDLMDFIPPTPYDLPLSGDHTPGSYEDCSRLGDQKAAKESQKFGKKAKGKNSGDESLQDWPMFEEGDIDDDFDDINNMLDEAKKNVEGDTSNPGGEVNTATIGVSVASTATTGVSASSASVATAGVSISTAESRTPPITTTTKFEDKDLTITQTLVKMRSEKAKEKGVTFKDVKEFVRPTTILPTIDPKDKEKGIMQDPEKPPKNPRNDQIQLDEELAKRMHEEEIAELEKRQSEIATTEEAKQKQFTIEEKSIMLVEMIAERKRFFAAQRAADQKSKPPTKAQMRNRMSTYLKNQAGYNHNQLKGRSYDEIQKLFDKAYKHVNSFVPMVSEMGKDSGKKDNSSSKQAGNMKKRAGLKLKPKSPKKLKVMKEQESAEDEQEKEELRLCLKIVQDEDRAINYETLAVKSLIVDWETQLLGSDLQGEDLSYWKITRADGSFRFYKVFSTILKEFDRQDLFDLHRLVIKRFKSVALEGYDLILWGDLKTMIKPNKEDEVWKINRSEV